MEKNTKILIGAGALALAYYLYNASKAAASVTPIGTTPMPVIREDVITDEKTLEALKRELALLNNNDPKYVIDHAGPDLVADGDQSRRIILVDHAGPDLVADGDQSRRILEKIAADNAIMDAQNKANQEAYLKAQADIKARNDENVAAAKAITDAAAKAKAEAEAKVAADEAARQKAMNEFVHGPSCPTGTEYYNGQCMPSYIVQEQKVTAQANNGEGLILRDYNGSVPKMTLVKTCPDGYVKQGIECIAVYMLSQSALQIIYMEQAGMKQTSDGQWYNNATEAAQAQAKIDADKAAAKILASYTPRQNNINGAICNVQRDGFINNPNSPSTNGMQLYNYIGKYSVTKDELAIAAASCPNSIYSLNKID